MRSTAVTTITSVLGAAGLALLLLEAVRVLTGTALGSAGDVMLYVGLGLVVVAGVIAVVSVLMPAQTAADNQRTGEPSPL